MSSFFELFKNLLFPPKCISCEELLDISLTEKCEKVLCSSCRGKFEKAKLYTCSECMHDMLDCRCMPKLLKASDACALISLFIYQPRATDDISSAADNIVYYLKRNNYRNGFDFLGKQLSYPLSAAMSDLGFETEDTVITFVPRRKSTVIKYGFDQSELLAKAISKRMKMECRSVLERKFSWRNQKSLNASQRIKNVKRAFAMKNPEYIMGRNIIIVDDVVTSGASMSECIKILKRFGAKRVICVSIAKSESIKSKRH
jgi:ComF family protein